MLSATSLQERRAALKQSGAIYIENQEGFLTDQEWDELERLCLASGLPYETVTIGDANEPNKVEVGRFMTDVEAPRRVNPDVSVRALEIIEHPRRMEMLSNLLGYERVFLRRVQVNHMHRGSFVGLHLDVDSNPDYEIAVVLQLGRSFEGGEFVIQLPEGGETSITPGYRSTIISYCNYPHEVRTVTGGIRTSLVYFVARHDGPNRRHLKSA
jgi:2-oxoglutarate-Fe(II)-dependent oxygenase superfamily protein